MRALQALPPLAAAIPLIAAAVLAGLSPVLRRPRLVDALALCVAAGVAGMCIALLLGTAGGGMRVHWFGGWAPRTGPAACHAVACALGIDFAVDAVGAAMASLAALLVCAALLFAWRYFDEAGTHFHVLMLAFLAAMVAFCFTGDLFDLFVFFELMGVCAYALTAYRIEEKGPVQGALNFALTNSVGAYLTLTGVALVYARTGALNLAQIGAALQGSADGVVVAGFFLVVLGFVVKAAIVPFHFWLADAHAAAPTPVCILFSGVMVELGLYAVARIYWTAFAPAFGAHATAVHGVLLGFGVVTALTGAVLCFSQHHIKRLLAFSTVSHAGLFLCGMALLTPLGLGAAGLYVLGHGLVKGALFVGAGILVHRFELIDEVELTGRGRQARMYGTGALFAVGGLALAGMPPFLTYMGKGLLEDASISSGLPWLAAVFVVSSALTGGAVLRVAGRVFLGLDDQPPPDRASQEAGHEEESGREDRTPAAMVLPMGLLLACACAAGLLPRLFEQAQLATARMLDSAGSITAILHAGGGAVAPAGPLEPTTPTLFDVGTGAAATAGALLLAGLAFMQRRGPVAVRRVTRLTAAAVAPLRRLHSGDVTDYVAWMMLGAGVLGGTLALAAVH